MRKLPKSSYLLSLPLVIGLFLACEKTQDRTPSDASSAEPEHTRTAEPAAVPAMTVQSAAARVEEPKPVETEAPNVPEFKPAFPGQTRAKAASSTTRFEVTEVARG